MQPLLWDCPYPSQRSPVFAQNIVASSQPLAVEAGISALRQGGNAVDAAIATAITLTVVEPNNNGIGSDAFALIHDGKQLHGLNASGRSPAGFTPAQALQAKAPHSVIRKAGQQCRSCSLAHQPHCNIGCRAAQISPKVAGFFDRGAIGLWHQIHTSPTHHQKRSAHQRARKLQIFAHKMSLASNH
jgi:hypothetical protein